MNAELNEQELLKNHEADLINEALNDPNRKETGIPLDTFIKNIIDNGHKNKA